MKVSYFGFIFIK
jgi:hypothetical protein